MQARGTSRPEESQTRGNIQVLGNTSSREHVGLVTCTCGQREHVMSAEEGSGRGADFEHTEEWNGRLIDLGAHKAMYEPLGTQTKGTYRPREHTHLRLGEHRIRVTCRSAKNTR